MLFPTYKISPCRVWHIMEFKDNIMMAFKTCYPQIRHLGILNILKWRSFRKMAEARSFVSPLSSPKAGHKTFKWEVPSLYPEERSILITKMRGHWTNKPCYVSPSLLPLAHTLCPILFLHDCPFIIKTSIKTLRLNYFFGSSFPYKGSYIM